MWRNRTQEVAGSSPASSIGRPWKSDGYRETLVALASRVTGSSTFRQLISAL
jgi:hypothetical protein